MQSTTLYDEAIERLQSLLAEARRRSTGELDPAAAVLATADMQARPSARTASVTAVERSGLVFFVNRHSGKADQLERNPHAAICFVWASVQYQVTVEGRVEPLPDELADHYWQRRPREVQLAAWADDPPAPIPASSETRDVYRHLRKHFTDGRVPRPPFWQGLRVAPSLVQFWHIGWNPLHDRTRYLCDDSGHWYRELHGAV